MKHDETRLTNYQHYPSLDGQSQLRTMADWWKRFLSSRKGAIFDERWETSELVFIMSNDITHNETVLNLTQRRKEARRMIGSKRMDYVIS